MVTIKLELFSLLSLSGVTGQAPVLGLCFTAPVSKGGLVLQLHTLAWARERSQRRAVLSETELPQAWEWISWEASDGLKGSWEPRSILLPAEVGWRLG